MASKKKGVLGKGLSALLPSDEDRQAARKEGVSRSEIYQFEDAASPAVGQLAHLPISEIDPNPHQPRQEFADKALDELAASIKELGVIQPVTVRITKDGQYELVSGERRLRAAKRAGLTKLPAYLREADSEAMLEMALVENVQREELNPIEVALGYQQLIEECDLTQAEVAKKVGKGRATIANFLRLLRLPPHVQAGLRDKSLSVGHARALINVDDEDVQSDLLDAIAEEDLTVRDVEERVRAWRRDEEEDDGEASSPDAPTSDAPSRDDLQVKAFTDTLRSYLGTQVQVKHKGSGEGKIEISYYSAKDLERLMELVMD